MYESKQLLGRDVVGLDLDGMDRGMRMGTSVFVRLVAQLLCSKRGRLNYYVTQSFTKIGWNLQRFDNLRKEIFDIFSLAHVYLIDKV